MKWDPTLDNGLKENGNSGHPAEKWQKEDSNKTSHADRERRMGIDRRNFSYTLYVPERRRGHERRIGSEMPCCADR